MAVVDSSSRFLYVNVGAQGSNNDASILKQSRFFQRLQSGQLRIPDAEEIFINENVCPLLPYFFIGDGGFGIHTHLLTPYRGMYVKF